MAAKNSMEEEIIVEGNLSDVFKSVSNVLDFDTYKNLNIDNDLHQITANYKDDSIKGEIFLSFISESEKTTKIKIESTASNSISSFMSSSEVIIEMFKERLKTCNDVNNNITIDNKENLNNNLNIINNKKPDNFFKLLRFIFSGIIIVIICTIFISKLLYQKNIENTEDTEDTEDTENIEDTIYTEDIASVLENNIYMGEWNSEYAKHDGFSAIIKFNSDKVVELLHISIANDWSFKYDKYYGIYELDGKKLSITLSLMTDVNLTCIVHDSGESITINGEEFKKTEPSHIRSEALKLFD